MKIISNNIYIDIACIVSQNDFLIKSYIKGHSMYPILKEKDIVVFKRFNIYQRGDIILFDLNNLLVAHRIIDFDNDKFITKGDNSICYDSSINLDNILGKLVLLKRGNKTIDCESMKWKVINHIIRTFPTQILFFNNICRFSRKCASWLFRLVMGTNYRAWKGKRKRISIY